MILRKPYALLIKNFKRIHFFLFITMSYIYYYSNQILSFFDKYDEKKQVFFNGDLSTHYVTALMYIVTLLIIAVTTIIFILMRQKKKPTKLYVLMTIYYIILFTFFIINASYLNTIQFEGLEPQTVRIIRDMNFISIVAQILFTIFIFIRAIGFDIKKFNFGEDIAELEIDVTDNEEFELTSGINTDEVGRKYRKQLRELKYFYEENKTVITGIIAIFIIFIVSLLVFKSQITNKINKQDTSINLNNMYLKLNDVYATKLNYKGVDISEKGYTFIVIPLILDNKGDEDRKLSIDNLKIEIGTTIYSRDITKYEYFRDIGIGYYDQKIVKNTKKEYIVVFKVKDEEVSKDMILRYADTIYFSQKKLSTKYIKIKIKPENIDTVTEFKKAALEKEIYYGLSFIKKTTLEINSIEFNNRFKYVQDNLESYIVEPISSNVILKISYDLKLDESITYIKTFIDMINRFGKITYNYNGKVYTAKYLNLTPINYANNNVYLSVEKIVAESTNIELVITVRNKRYTYILKQ